MFPQTSHSVFYLVPSGVMPYVYYGCLTSSHSLFTHGGFISALIRGYCYYSNDVKSRVPATSMQSHRPQALTSWSNLRRTHLLQYRSHFAFGACSSYFRPCQLIRDHQNTGWISVTKWSWTSLHRLPHCHLLLPGGRHTLAESPLNPEKRVPVARLFCRKTLFQHLIRWYVVVVRNARMQWAIAGCKWLLLCSSTSMLWHTEKMTRLRSLQKFWRLWRMRAQMNVLRSYDTMKADGGRLRHWLPEKRLVQSFVIAYIPSTGQVRNRNSRDVERKNEEAAVTLEQNRMGSVSCLHVASVFRAMQQLWYLVDVSTMSSAKWLHYKPILACTLV